jgi:hypothetical protein
VKTKINKKWILVLIIIITFLTLNKASFIKFSKANPAPVKFVGGILPKENLNLSLTNAEVFFNVNTTDFPYYNYSFNSNYTIFNPNEQVNITIAMPFLMDIWDVKNFILRVDYIEIPFTYNYTLTVESEIWQEYLSNFDYPSSSLSSTCFYIFNISIPTNDSVMISCSFEHNYDYMAVGKYALDMFELIYIVGTARIWNGNITERIEFDVCGRFPDNYTHQEDCNMSTIETFRKYIWEWDNEIIEVNYVGISWHYEEEKNHKWLRRLLVIMGFPAIIIVVIKYHYIRKKRIY